MWHKYYEKYQSLREDNYRPRNELTLPPEQQEWRDRNIEQYNALRDQFDLEFWQLTSIQNVIDTINRKYSYFSLGGEAYHYGFKNLTLFCPNSTQQYEQTIHHTTQMQLTEDQVSERNGALETRFGSRVDGLLIPRAFFPSNTGRGACSVVSILPRDDRFSGGEIIYKIPPQFENENDPAFIKTMIRLFVAGVDTISSYDNLNKSSFIPSLDELALPTRLVELDRDLRDFILMRQAAISAAKADGNLLVPELISQSPIANLVQFEAEHLALSSSNDIDDIDHNIDE